MILMGSIFVPLSFILLGAAVTGKFPWQAKISLSFIAPWIYIAWLFSIQLSTRLMNDMESEFEILVKPEGYRKIMRKFYGIGHGRTWTMRARRNHWLIYVVLLTLSASLVIGSALAQALK